MKGIRIQGGMPLQGKVRIQGLKMRHFRFWQQRFLPMKYPIFRIAHVLRMCIGFVHLLRELGCMVHWQENGIRVQPGGRDDLPCERAEARRMRGEAITGMRSSLCLLGALLGKCGYVTMEHPGGCVIGDRPIDLHIMALEQMGVEFLEEDGLLSARARKTARCPDYTEVPSVGATENILLAAVKATGDTVITGAAREPEVIALCEFLTACGLRSKGWEVLNLSSMAAEIFTEHGSQFRRTGSWQERICLAVSAAAGAYC